MFLDIFKDTPCDAYLPAKLAMFLTMYEYVLSIRRAGLGQRSDSLSNIKSTGHLQPILITIGNISVPSKNFSFYLIRLHRRWSLFNPSVQQKLLIPSNSTSPKVVDFYSYNYHIHIKILYDLAIFLSHSTSPELIFTLLYPYSASLWQFPEHHNRYGTR